jgi:hypothetical protein
MDPNRKAAERQYCLKKKENQRRGIQGMGLPSSSVFRHDSTWEQRETNRRAEAADLL